MEKSFEGLSVKFRVGRILKMVDSQCGNQDNFKRSLMPPLDKTRGAHLNGVSVKDEKCETS